MHLKHHQEGFDYLCAFIKQKFAVLKICSTLRFSRFSCLLWWRRIATSVKPKMPHILSELLGFQSVNSRIWVLITSGPLYVSKRRTSDKKWRFFFTCRTTRALRDKIAHSMDINTCVKGNERFVACRGLPSINSPDNGINESTFSQLKKLLACLLSWDMKLIALKREHKELKSKFNPPASVANRRLIDAKLQTFFFLIEQTLNKHLLTTFISDSNNFNP